MRHYSYSTNESDASPTDYTSGHFKSEDAFQREMQEIMWGAASGNLRDFMADRTNGDQINAARFNADRSNNFAWASQPDNYPPILEFNTKGLYT